MFDCKYKLNQIGVKYHKLEGVKEKKKRCKLIFEKKKKNKAHKPKRPTWPLKPTSSHYPLYSHHIRSLLKGALMKFMWEPCFGYGLYILNTYPHYTGLFGVLSEFLLAVDCIACFLFLPHHTRLFFQ